MAELTLAKVQNYVDWYTTAVEHKRNEMERAQRIFDEHEQALEKWTATLEKMKSE